VALRNEWAIRIVVGGSQIVLLRERGILFAVPEGIVGEEVAGQRNQIAAQVVGDLNG
jgi:hypothetical protein